MTTTSGVTSTTASVSTGNAQDISSLMAGNVSLSLAEAVTVKVQPYLDQATAVQTNINTNQSKIAAYQNMQSLLQALETSASNLSSQAVQGANVFNNRVANLSATANIQGGTPSNPSALMSVSVAAGTNTGSHSVIVNRLATAESDLSKTLGASTTALGLAGTIQITETGKTAVPITVTSTMAPADIAAAINGTTAQTGVTASVISVSSSQSVLVVQGADTDVPLQFTDGGGVLAGLGVGPTLTGNATPAITSTTTSVGNTASTFSITIGNITANVSGANAIPANDTLTDIQSKINAAWTAAGGTGSIASISGTNPYNLQISSSGTGSPTSAVQFSSATGNLLSTLGMPPGQSTAANSANLTVDGVSGITSTTNVVSSVLTGVTMNLSGADPNTTVTMNIAPDTNGATTAIQSFVTAYNNWQNFVNQNEATTSSGTAAAGAVLFGDSTMREASQQVSTAISAIINNYTLAQLGLTLDGNNNLQVNSTTLSQQLTTNFSSVVGLFNSQVTTNNYALQPLGTDYSTYAGTFTMGITDSAGTITLDPTSAASFTVNGTTISGNYGTPYFGMSFNWSGGNTAGTNVTITGTQGLANQLYTSSDQYGNAVSGSVQSLIQNLQTQDLNLTSQYNTLINQANNYTNFLLQQYSQLASQMQAAGQTSTVLQAMFSMQTGGGHL